jgi:hypothetical protein
MKPTDIEYRVLTRLQNLADGRKVEDKKVELKRELPEPQRAARRIAALCNAASGEDVLWIVGADESGVLTTLPSIDLASWWLQVCAEFDELPPAMEDLFVPFGPGAVLALSFRSDRAPYVVRNPVHGSPGGGPVAFEVPWREGTATRSAHRSELLRILVPASQVPTLEPISCSFAGNAYNPSVPQRFIWNLYFSFYIVPATKDPVVIPFHRCHGQVEVEGVPEPVRLDRITITSYGHPTTGQSGSQNVLPSTADVIAIGPGKLDLMGSADWSEPPPTPGPLARLTLELRTAGSQQPLIVRAVLRRDRDFRFIAETIDVS